MYKRGYSLTGKTMILRIIILGSSPGISNKKWCRAQVTQLVEYNIEAISVISSNLILSRLLRYNKIYFHEF